MFNEMVVFIIFVMFINWLEGSQLRYIEQFKAETIEMDDFTIRVKSLPNDYMIGHEPSDLKILMQYHFERVIQAQI